MTWTRRRSPSRFYQSVRSHKSSRAYRASTISGEEEESPPGPNHSPQVPYQRPPPYSGSEAELQSVLTLDRPARSHMRTRAESPARRLAQSTHGATFRQARGNTRQTRCRLTSARQVRRTTQPRRTAGTRRSRDVQIMRPNEPGTGPYAQRRCLADSRSFSPTRYRS